MDSYRVVAADGKEYGPVDLDGVYKWIREGRILRTTLLRKNDGAPIAAEFLSELSTSFMNAGVPAGAATATGDVPFGASATTPAMNQPFTTPTPATLVLPLQFRSWEFIGLAWKFVQVHWMPLVVMFVIADAVSLVPYVGGCVSFLLQGVLMVGVNRAVIGMIGGQPPKVEMMFTGFDRFGAALAASIVSGLLICIGLLLLVVPGIILAIMWLFVYIVLAETNMDFWQALSHSADVTSGHKWDLFCLMMALVVIGIAGILCFCVGIVVSQAIIATTLVLVYRFLQARPQAVAA